MTSKKVLATFACLWIAWILFTGSLSAQELLTGGIVAGIISGASYELFTRNPRQMMEPKRWGYLLAYAPVYLWEEIKAHLNVGYRILHPKLPLNPAIVKLSSELKSDVGLTTLANSITMTPGTLTVDIDEDESDLFVHWISAEAVEEEEVQSEVGEPLEKYLKGGLG